MVVFSFVEECIERVCAGFNARSNLSTASGLLLIICIEETKNVFFYKPIAGGGVERSLSSSSHGDHWIAATKSLYQLHLSDSCKYNSECTFHFF